MSGVDSRRATVWHEAFTLPLVFLSVALLGGLRIDVRGGLGFVPPPLMALVLAVVLIAVLYRSGALGSGASGPRGAQRARERLGRA